MPSFDQRQYVQLKSSLTRAMHRGDPGVIIDTVIKAHNCFNATGYPDDWSVWQRAGEDALNRARRIIQDF